MKRAHLIILLVVAAQSCLLFRSNMQRERALSLARQASKQVDEIVLISDEWRSNFYACQTLSEKKEKSTLQYMLYRFSLMGASNVVLRAERGDSVAVLAFEPSNHVDVSFESLVSKPTL